MADVDDEKLAEVASRLEKLTKSGHARWETTDQPDTFLFTAPSSSVLVGSLNGDGEDPLFMRVLSPDGEVTDSLETATDATLNVKLVARPRWFYTLRDLHRRARRSATEADALVDSLLADLKSLDPGPW